MRTPLVIGKCAAICGIGMFLCGSLPAARTTSFFGISSEKFGLVGIDPGTGETTLVLSGHFWTGLDFTPDGATLYGTSNRLFTVDLAGGSYTEIGPILLDGSGDPIQMLSMSMAPEDGEMLAVSNPLSDPASRRRLYRMDRATGHAEVIGNSEVRAIEFAPDGTLYGVDSDLVTLDPDTGAILRRIGALDTLLVIDELDFSNDGHLYGTSHVDGLFRIDTATGAATLVTAYAGGDQVWSVVTEFDSQVSASGTIYGFPPTIEWRSMADEHYQVWASPDLVGWVPASAVLPGAASGVGCWTDNGQHELGPATGAPKRYYRVELVEVVPTLRFFGGTGSGGPNTFDLVELDIVTGETTAVVNRAVRNGLDFTPDGGTLYGIGSATLYTLDVEAGTYTEVAPLTYQGSEPIGMRSMTIAPDGRMFALSSGSSDPSGEERLYRVDSTTGNLELLGQPDGFLWGIEFGPDGTLYGAEFDLLVLDPTDGSIVRTIGDLGSSLLVTELDFAADGTLYGTDSDNGLYRIDTSTGAATQVVPYPEGSDEIWSIATQLR